MVVNGYTAGNPMKSGVLWTNLTCRKISGLLSQHAIAASVYIVRQLLDITGYVKRKMLKCKTMKAVANRNDQFVHIAGLREEFSRAGLPVLSIDSKKKEMLGNFYRTISSQLRSMLRYQFRPPRNPVRVNSAVK